MKIYTKTGDKGKTSLFGGERVDKDDLRVECYGTVDELNSTLGLTITEITNTEVKDTLKQIQNDLFNLAGELATPSKKEFVSPINQKQIEFLENQIDNFEEKIPPLKQFILPGGSKGAALLHVARSVCRRSERIVVKLSKNDVISDNIIIYLNRLSDLLFVLARFENDVNQIPDIPWDSK
ncbi:ATP:Cob(I)alamin adenosyltransferase [hydrothermal vent metagenome]|uniref:ATP:Cob(I)alamin adenosyltransferase n=1 Tax=hydrothermal vent metagenome TaxID=652676 RepID=A0A3B1CEY7_9ZZZZ